MCAPAQTGNVVASAGEDGRVRLWYGAAGDVETLTEEPGWIEQLEWIADGSVLAATAVKTIYLWQGSESLGMWYDARRRVPAMAWAPLGKRLATASSKGVDLWSLGNDEPVELLAFPGAAVAVAWNNKDNNLAAGTQDGFLQLWRQTTVGRTKQLTMRGYQGKVNCLDWHPWRDAAATAGGKEVVVWNLATCNGKQQARPLRRHQTTVTCLGYSPDGRCLASGDRLGHICLWDVNGDLVREWREDSELTVIRWSADGDYLAVGTTTGQLQVYAASRPGAETWNSYDDDT